MNEIVKLDRWSWWTAMVGWTTTSVLIIAGCYYSSWWFLLPVWATGALTCKLLNEIGFAKAEVEVIIKNAPRWDRGE